MLESETKTCQAGERKCSSLELKRHNARALTLAGFFFYAVFCLVRKFYLCDVGVAPNLSHLAGLWRSCAIRGEKLARGDSVFFTMGSARAHAVMF